MLVARLPGQQSGLTLSATGKHAALNFAPPSSDVCSVMPGTPAMQLRAIRWATHENGEKLC